MWLRPVGPEDLDALVALDADPLVMRHINGGHSVPRRAYEDELLGRMMAHGDRRCGFFSAFAAPDEGEFLGWFHLRPSVFDARIHELGYRLRREVWGRGLATEGSRALLDHGFAQLGAAAVDACALRDNGASIAVMRKCGMSYVGMFEHPRAGVRLARYLVARSSWQALRREDLGR